MFPCPGLRGCLCFSALPPYGFCGEEVLCLFSRQEGFVLGCGAYKGLLGRESGEAGGHWSMEGRGLCSGYRPPQPANEMPLRRV